MYVYDTYGNYLKTYTDADYASWLPFPAPDANKYTRGKCVMIAGSDAYPGAAIMCARATQLSGAGYTELFTAKRNVAIVQGDRPSLVVRSFKKLDDTCHPNKKRHGAFVYGPGIDDRDPESESLLLRCIEGCRRPLLIDGGGLHLLSKPKLHDAMLRRAERGQVTVLTPHPGEAALLGIPFGIEPTDDLEQMAMQLASCYSCLIVLKGPDTTIADSSGYCTFDEGTSALAKAGTGDVLAGIIGGFLAQGIAPHRACILGVVLHARAGLIAASCVGPICVCADDLLEMFPTAIMDLAEELNTEE